MAALLAGIQKIMREEIAQNNAALRAEFARGGGAVESPPAPSYATVGSEALAALQASERIALAGAPAAGAPAAECAPIASPDDLARLATFDVERDLVADIMPLLRAARGFAEAGAGDPCARILVNSERTPWLDSLAAPLSPDQLKRPDLFATWAPFWSGREAAEGGATGRLAGRALQLDGCVREFYEAKVGTGDLTASDFGQLLDYHSRVRGPVRGMLFNARHFWLFQSVRCHPVKLTKGLLGAPGSSALMRRFFEGAEEPEPQLLTLLRHLFRELRVAPRRIAVGAHLSGGGGGGGGGERTSAFLGAGGSARVFCVASEATGKPCALKASLTLSHGDLHYEFTVMQRAVALGAPVVPVVAGSLTVLSDEEGAYRGGGFLLRDVCQRAVLDSGARVAAAFEALRALHAAGVAHGDARLPNLVRRAEDGTLLWIDLREARSKGAPEGVQQSAAALQAAQRADARTLAASMLGLAAGGVLPAAVVAALVDVPTSAAAYAALAAAVRAGCA